MLLCFNVVFVVCLVLYVLVSPFFNRVFVLLLFHGVLVVFFRSYFIQCVFVLVV